ncbi:PREDICTED: uncharacterized protein LOC109463351, partial [Branchiostoma belcheri]|uniref:Uncharacterized protein LOC109463351 n=1 Tax=Branchiostoma belcheri TaxID=7741 RepID=A0A6P4XUE4_BRABE
DDSLTDKLDTNTLEQCRQVWEYAGGIAMDLGGSSYFQLVSLSTGNSTFEGVGMSFVQTQDTNTLTTRESGYGQTHTAITNANHDHAKNITCILLTKDKHTTLFFTTPQDQLQTHKATYSTETGHSVSLTHYTKHTEKYYPSSEMVGNSTLKASSTSGPDMPLSTDHVLISVVAVSALVGLVLSSLLVLVLKLCSKGTSEDERDSDDAHVWTVPPGVAFPGLLRSASLPARGKMALDAVVSCRSLPVVLHSVQPTYSEIPDDVACAQRPLPSLPHDDVMVRSASLPARTRGSAPDDAASCRSLPTVLQSIEPTYSEIPDHMAAAQRPLPALPRTSWEITEHGAAAQRPLPVPHHTYSEIPDDESGPMPFYTDPGGFSLHVVKNRGQNKRAFRNVTTTFNRHLSGRSMATYGSAEQNKAQGDSVYRMAIDVQGIRARRNLRTGLVSQAIDQSVRTYVNVTDAILSRGQEVTEAHIAFLTSPGTSGTGSWEISGEGTRNTPQRAPLPTVTLPNTYWPWEIPGKGTSNTARRVSLPTVTLPNTYWPWEIPGEETRNTPMHARVRSGARENAAMLFLLLFIATCTASDGPGSPQCKVAGWRVCVPLNGKMGQMKVSGTCVVCGVQIEGVAPVSPFSFLAGAQHVAIRGYPFHVLSANSLTPLEHSVVLTLALLNAKITDVKNNTLAGFSSLVQLSLDSNRLTNVKKTWFTAGLKNLRWLTLSNNYIKQIQPGSFANLTRLYGLNLKNNLLQVVDPAWLFGLKGHMLMNLGLNAINSIAPGSFRDIQLYWLDLSGTDLSCLDEDVFRGQSWLGRLRVSSGTLSSVHDAKPHEMTWSLQRFFLAMRGSAVLAVVVPRFHFCVSHNRVTPGFSFWWMFDSSDSVPYNIAPTAYACGIFKSSLISIQPPVVVLAIDDSLTDKLETNSPEQCRQVWEYDGGIAMELGGSSYFRLVSLSTGNSTFEGVGMSFAQTQDTNTLTTTESGYGQTHTAITNANHDHAKNITCILLTKDKHTTLFFTTPQDQLQTHKATYSTETGHS